MKERPISLMTPLVEAVLLGEKDVTRRLHSVLKDGSCPYGVVGDHLWVKETHTVVGDRVYHRATDAKPLAVNWVGGRFMRKEYHRLRLELLAVDAVRLKSQINVVEVAREGIRCQAGAEPVAAFATLWDGMYGQGSFDADPDVWRLEFRVSGYYEFDIAWPEDDPACMAIVHRPTQDRVYTTGMECPWSSVKTTLDKLRKTNLFTRTVTPN